MVPQATNYPQKLSGLEPCANTAQDHSLLVGWQPEAGRPLLTTRGSYVCGPPGWYLAVTSQAGLLEGSTLWGYSDTEFEEAPLSLHQAWPNAPRGGFPSGHIDSLVGGEEPLEGLRGAAKWVSGMDSESWRGSLEP